MDIELLLAIGGILLTIVTFVVGYRKTVGAKNERVRTANDILSTSLAKHFSLSTETLSQKQITSLRIGQAIASGIEQWSILDEDLLRDLVFSKIFNNEYLTYPEKTAALTRLQDSFYVSPREALRSARRYRGARDSAGSKRQDTTTQVALLGLISAIISILAAFLVASTDVISLDPAAVRGVLPALAISVLATSLILVLVTELRRRSSRTAISTASPPRRPSVIWERVQALMLELSHYEAPIDEVDFIFAVSTGEKVGVEVRDSTRYPIRDVEKYVAGITRGKEKHGLDIVIAVVSEDLKAKFRDVDLPEGVRAMSLDEFESFIVAQRTVSTEAENAEENDLQPRNGVGDS